MSFLPSRAQIAHVGCMASTGISVVAFSALNITTPSGSAPLNCAVNWITGGRINRDTLAQTVVRNSLFLGLSSQFAEKDLSDRSARLAQLTSKIVFDNTADEMHASIKSLTQELLYSETTYKPGLPWACENLKRQFFEAGITTIAELTENSVKEPNFIEKLVATNISLHGKEPLQKFMEKALSALPIIGTKFIANLVTDILERAIVNKPEFDQHDRPIFKFLAAETNELLTDKKNYKKPLADYCEKMSVDAATSDLQKAALRFTHKYCTGDESITKLLADSCKEIAASDTTGEIGKSVLETARKFFLGEERPNKPIFDYYAKTITMAASNTSIEFGRALLLTLGKYLANENDYEKPLTEYSEELLEIAEDKLADYMILAPGRIAIKVSTKIAKNGFNLVGNVSEQLMSSFFGVLLGDPYSEEEEEEEKEDDKQPTIMQRLQNLGNQLQEATIWPDPEDDGLDYTFGESAM